MNISGNSRVHQNSDVSSYLYCWIAWLQLSQTKGLPCRFLFLNVFVKPDEQSRACLSCAMARKRRMKSNVFVKPDEQSRACLSSVMARKGGRKPIIFYFIVNDFCKIGWQVVKPQCLSGLQPVLRLSKVDKRLTRKAHLLLNSLKNLLCHLCFCSTKHPRLDQILERILHDSSRLTYGSLYLLKSKAFVKPNEQDQACLSTASFGIPANFNPCAKEDNGVDEFGIDEVYE